MERPRRERATKKEEEERINMESCELCNSPARMYCESDQASLCWGCDSKVHGANFLAARHSRSLLCHLCQSPTPWSASGAELGLTVSVCERCVDGDDGLKCRGPLFQENGDSSGDETDGGDELEIDDDDSGDNDDTDEDSVATDYDEEEKENQVVPWSSTPPPPPATSSSSSGESSNGFCNCNIDSATPYSLKRTRECCSDLRYQEDIFRRRDNGTAVLMNRGDDTYEDYVRPLKDRKTGLASNRTVQNRTGTIVESIRRYQREIASCDNASAAIIDLCILTEDRDGVDTTRSPATK
ncbi:hypothetical protein Nepgr_000486 [Nepenthes gracilis]|uniref:B box-type domain-containing protein n=1 Tax=Nepenthes gracilis TaxID=150966 RepID=A0AAD3P3W7_NEPGR|nr:hypothetical protein Nepgr_000486 [Nepenthes gracilis]